MSDTNVRHNFALQNQMWYDLRTGDILTEASAMKLVKSKHRVADMNLKILATSKLQFAPFRNPKRMTTSVLVVDKWSPDTYALQFKDVGSKKLFLSDMENSDIATFEYQGMVILKKESRGDVVSMLKSQGNQVTFTTRDLKDNEDMTKTVRVYNHVNSIKGQDRTFKLTSGDKLLTIVCDGHGDNSAINYITSHTSFFQALIADPFPTSNALALERTTRVFVEFENTMRKNVNALHGGSTMVFAAHDVKAGKVFFGYIGDSRAVYQRNPKSEILYTHDHKPDHPYEMERVRKLGGEVTFHHNDVPRVNGNLATSRSFGDETLKHQGGDRYLDLVSVIPEVLGPVSFEAESVYFLASDGVFDVYKNEEVIETLRSRAEPATMGHNVMQMSRMRGSRDDISMIFVMASK